MRRRLIAAIAGMAVLILVLSGIGTLLLAKRAASNDTRRQIQTITRAIARATAAGHVISDLRLIRTAARLDGAAFLPVDALGRITGTPPSGLTLAQLEPDRLLAGQTVISAMGSLEYGAEMVVVHLLASPSPSTAGTAQSGTAQSGTAQSGTAQSGTAPTRVRLSRQIVVLTRKVPPVTFTGGYLILAGIILGASVIVAFRLARRITRPLTQAVATTRLIAGGNLQAQVLVRPGDYPELAGLGHSINSMASALERSRGLERQFLMSVSHDLRTPLTSIRGYAEAIADGTAPDVHRASLIIAGESKRLERLVGDLLELAKLDARRFSLTLRPVDITDVVADVAEGFRPSMSGAGLALHIELVPDRELWARIDPDRLAQCVANLIENAFNFARGYVLVRAERGPAPGVLSVAVSDDGPGIAADQLTTIFNRNFTASPVRQATRHVGSGLGLTIVKELVEAMGGSVQAHSPADRATGTRVVICLKELDNIVPDQH
ncbi:MAG: sensor histidine kinase [Acidimicrobiales bacterium]